MSPWNLENGPETLGNLRPGHPAAVLNVGASAQDGSRLQELGFVAGMPVEVLSCGGTLMVRLGEQRMCLCLESADEVSVTPI